MSEGNRRIRAYSKEYYEWSGTFYVTLGYYAQVGDFMYWFANKNISMSKDEQYIHNLNYVPNFSVIKKLPRTEISLN